MELLNRPLVTAIVRYLESRAGGRRIGSHCATRFHRVSATWSGAAPAFAASRSGRGKPAMTTAIKLEDITIQSVVEQQGPFFDAMEFFPTLTRERLEENRAWLKPTFIDRSNRLVFCIQSLVVRTPRHNILIDSCVGNHKRRPLWPFWNMMSSDRFETGLAAIGLAVSDIDYVMCTHLHVDHVGWNTRLENGRWVPTFPKAKYVMADRELAYWTEKEKADPSSLPWITDSVLPIVAA